MTPAATATTPRTATIAAAIIPAAKMANRYGSMLLADIPADRFAHMPHPTMNHPAFNVGHLSLYPNRVLTLIGRVELIVEKPGWSDLFKAGTACVEQDSRYPAKDELVAQYQERYAAAVETLAGVDDDVLGQPNPTEGRFRELLPTIGAAVNFLLGGHHMSHLGQISAWRRAVGLPSVM